VRSGARLPGDALIEESDQEVVPALRATGAGEAVGEDATLEVASELMLDIAGTASASSYAPPRSASQVSRCV